MRSIISQCLHVEWLSVVNGAADPAVIDQDEPIAGSESIEE
jgi:hypothetical protein